MPGGSPFSLDGMDVAIPLTAPIKDRPDWKQAYTDKTVLGRWATTIAAGRWR